MGIRSTITGYWRQRGATNSSSSKLPPIGPTPAVMPGVLRFSFDTAVATAAQGLTVPAGARIIAIETDGGGAGITPTVDIGTAADDDGFAAELPSDSAQRLQVGSALAGVLFGTVLASDTEIYAGVGAAAGTGTLVVLVHWIMDDDGAVAN